MLDLSENVKLRELPLEICRLEYLEYLNLSRTMIEKMSVEMKNLTKLRYLILDNSNGILIIPPNVISCLSNLQMFRMLHSSLKDIKEYQEVGVLQELECLQYLNELSIKLSKVLAVQNFLTSQKLQKCLRMLQVEHCRG